VRNFASVADAVRCAVEVQREMAGRNTDVPSDRHIEFRMGINVGDIIRDGRDIYGDEVNVAARLEALAEPGGICVSRVRDQVRDKLTFPGIKWHDGKPFTAADVKCTWDLLTGKSQEKLRLNPRKAWYRNLADVVPAAEHAVTFVLKRSQPAFLMLLASGMSPVYPCHVPPRNMRTHPMGTGPFKFAAFKPNEFIRVVKNPDYWKPGRPYLDGIEWTIIPNRSTQTLAFIAGKFDMSFPYEVTLHSMRDIRNQAPNAICEITPTPVAMNLLVNRDAAPFNDAEIRRAMQLTIDRKSFLDIIAEGEGDINGAMQAPPAGLWGLPPEILTTLPGYSPDVAANRVEARKLMARHGYDADHRLAVKVATRNIAQHVAGGGLALPLGDDPVLDADLLAGQPVGPPRDVAGGPNPGSTGLEIGIDRDTAIDRDTRLLGEPSPAARRCRRRRSPCRAAGHFAT